MRVQTPCVEREKAQKVGTTGHTLHPPVPAPAAPPAAALHAAGGAARARAARRCALSDVTRKECVAAHRTVRLCARPEPQGADAQARAERAAAQPHVRGSQQLRRRRCAPAARLNEGKWDVRQLVTSGGMPSSHSALVRAAAPSAQCAPAPTRHARAGCGAHDGGRPGRRLWRAAVRRVLCVLRHRARAASAAAAFKRRAGRLTLLPAARLRAGHV